MGQAGCRRISIGLETLDAKAQQGLPRLKQTSDNSFEALAGWCNDVGIELNCFVIVGLPGSTPQGDELTVARVKQLGARVRPMMYTPFDSISGDMSAAQVASYNRQLGHESASPEDARRRYAILFGPTPTVSPTTARVPQRSK
jgi:hypothetical protein